MLALPAILSVFGQGSTGPGDGRIMIGAATHLPNDQEQIEFIRRIYDEILVNAESYTWLDHLANKIGGRLSGSPQAAAAVEWSRQVMDTLGLDSVWLQPVMVPHWTRGEREYARLISPEVFGETELTICALGGSVATPEEGLTAQVVEVRDYAELQKLGAAKVKGRIVFYNNPFNPLHVNAFQAYSEGVKYRSTGAIEAAKLGAAGVLIRSLTHVIDDNPHTGAMRYSDEPQIRKIPAAAVSTKGAEILSQWLRKDPGLRFHFRMHCRWFPDKLSYNVIGEIRGSEFPDEIITVGGHLDSWDNGDGAHDDGAGCVQSMEVLRTFRALGHKPRRTVRAVLFMNEENGLRGGREYARIAKLSGHKYLAAIESDAGGFSPRGFSVDGDPEALATLQGWATLLEPYDLHKMDPGYGGADIGPLRELGTACIGLRPDAQRYFDYHHAPSDKFEAVNKRELVLGAAAMAALTYLISENGL